jgi:cyclophilin family peptidyl-prolyl cis-trans isomerase
MIPLDTVRMTGDLGNGIIVPLHPFFGSMGVAPPPDSGRVSSNPPGIHAGNLDNRELVAGTVLFIPVHAAGALFEVGDGHAAQGDGEVDQTAIETSLRGRLQFIVRKGHRLTWPRAETLSHVITMGTDTNLTVATRIALRNMIDYLTEARALPQVEAYRLASIAGDLRITQLVDGRVGVHMMIPKELIGTGAMSPETPTPAPAQFLVELATSRGKFEVEVHRDWAPHGADRFYELVKSGYFDNSRFFRVRPGDIAQFGIPGVGTWDSRAATTAWSDWRYRAIADDSVREKNERGSLVFAMTGPNTRTTQLFVNLKDDLPLDAQGFAPLGRVVKGMDVLDRLYSGYGDSAGGGMRGRRQDPMFQDGNKYLDEEFPKLDKLIRARVVEEKP